MDTYSVETDSDGGFRVRSNRDGDDVGQVVAAFPTRREAEQWISDQIQIAMRSANASDVA